MTTKGKVGETPTEEEEMSLIAEVESSDKLRSPAASLASGRKRGSDLRSGM